MGTHMLDEIAELAKELKNKTTKAHKMIEKLNRINYKIESLLNSLDAYADDQSGQEKTRNKNLYKDTISVKDNDEHILTKIETLFAKDKKNHSKIAIQIFLIIKENRSILLDDIVKNVKLSKYKIIDILNILVRENLVSRKFDRGFMYEIVQ